MSHYYAVQYMDGEIHVRTPLIQKVQLNTINNNELLIFILQNNKMMCICVEQKT